MGSDRERVKCFSSNLFPISTVDLKKKKSSHHHSQSVLANLSLLKES